MKAIEPSNPVISSIQEDPIKPVTPVTFPESGTESEVSLARNTSLAFILLRKQHVIFQNLLHKIVLVLHWA